MCLLKWLFGSKKQPEAPAPPKRSDPIHINVVGMSHRADNVRSLGYCDPEYNKRKHRAPESLKDVVHECVFENRDYSAELVDEPDNPEDPNAIMVLVEGVHVGYVDRHYTTRVRNLYGSNPHVTARLKGGGKLVPVKGEDGELRYMKEKGLFKIQLTVHP